MVLGWRNVWAAGPPPPWPAHMLTLWPIGKLGTLPLSLIGTIWGLQLYRERIPKNKHVIGPVTSNYIHFSKYVQIWITDVLVPQQGTFESGCMIPLVGNSDSVHLHMIHSWQTQCFRLLEEENVRRNVNISEVYSHEKNVRERWIPGRLGVVPLKI